MSRPSRKHMSDSDPRNASGSTPSADRQNDSGYNAGIAVFSYIIGGIVVWSLIGWGLDNLWGTRWIVLAGALLGAVGGFYLSHMHGLTSQRNTTGKSGDESGPSADGNTNAK